MITIIGGQKGGTGKSTLTTNLAVAFQSQGNSVIIIDADVAQPNTSYWAARREESDLPAITVVRKDGDLRHTLKELNQSYDHVLVDPVGHAGEELKSALEVADLLLTPVRPSQPDLESLRYIDELVRAKRMYNPKLRAMVVISQAPTHYQITLAQEARSAVSSLPSLEVADTVVHHRTAFIDAMSGSLGVTELRLSAATAAAAEIWKLADELWPANLVTLSRNKNRVGER